MTLPDRFVLHLPAANTIRVPGPAHHIDRIMAHLAEHAAEGPGLGPAAFNLASDAIAIAWAKFPDDYADLTYPQYRQLIRDRYWADIVGLALDVPGGPGPAHALDLAVHIAIVVMNDFQLNDRPHRAN
ncbi:hypothetical protein ACFV4P_03110 [Kitasatospora sp. NPDC059795]|uniref:hypothetical protein n=1 Tax=Kitasatospora sp. NPDC059795 TaxID=3346949 RepID=UPI00365D69BE